MSDERQTVNEEPDLIITRGTGSDADGKWVARPSMATELHVAVDGEWVFIEPTGTFESIPGVGVAEVWSPAGGSGS